MDRVEWSLPTIKEAFHVFQRPGRSRMQDIVCAYDAELKFPCSFKCYFLKLLADPIHMFRNEPTRKTGCEIYTKIYRNSVCDQLACSLVPHMERWWRTPLHNRHTRRPRLNKQRTFFTLLEFSNAQAVRGWSKSPDEKHETKRQRLYFKTLNCTPKSNTHPIYRKKILENANFVIFYHKILEKCKFCYFHHHMARVQIKRLSLF